MSSTRSLTVNRPLSISRVPTVVPALDAERAAKWPNGVTAPLVALFSDRWRLDSVLRANPEIMLEPLVADAE